MKNLRTLIGIACLSLTNSWANAQVASPSPSRAEVKAETKAAERNHQLTPAGENIDPKPAVQPKSTLTRQARKAETLQARKSGDLIAAGDAAEEAAIDKKASLGRSTKTRAERKTETIAARKTGQLLPAGEGQNAPAK